jgi:hypothetical protein
MYNINKNMFFPHNIGYDFDGVIHKSVSGELYNYKRDPVKQNNRPIKTCLLVPNDFIINLIYDQIIQGHNVFIITARANILRQMEIQVFLNEHLTAISFDKHGKEGKVIIFPLENIHIGKSNKIQTIKDLKLNEFTDDSIKHIIEAYNIKHAVNNTSLNELKIFLSDPLCDNEKPCVIEIVSLDQYKEVVKLSLDLLTTPNEIEELKRILNTLPQ